MEDHLKFEIKDGVKEVVIRKGEASKIVQPQAREVEGVLSCVQAYVEHQTELLDKKNVHVELDKSNLTAVLFVDKTDPLAGKVTGKIEISEEIKAFGINTNCGKLDEGEILRFLREKRFFWKDKEAHAKLYSSIKNFQASVKMDVQKSNNDRGSRSNSMNREVKADDVPFSAVITAEIFKGGGRKDIAIDICFDVTEGGAHFWFESNELDEVIKKETDAQFLALSEFLAEGGYLVIHK